MELYNKAYPRLENKNNIDSKKANQPEAINAQRLVKLYNIVYYSSLISHLTICKKHMIIDALVESVGLSKLTASLCTGVAITAVYPFIVFNKIDAQSLKKYFSNHIPLSLLSEYINHSYISHNTSHFLMCSTLRFAANAYQLQNKANIPNLSIQTCMTALSHVCLMAVGLNKDTAGCIILKSIITNTIMYSGITEKCTNYLATQIGH